MSTVSPGAGLSIRHLTLDYVRGTVRERALDDVSLTIRPGGILGLIGESGSGKSSLAYAVLRHLHDNARLVKGTIHLDGEDMLALGSERLRRIRAGRIGVVYQNPAASLAPTLRLGDQLADALRATAEAGAAGTATAAELLDRVRLPDPGRLMRRFPHEVSGGEKQRVLIAMAIRARPSLLVFDEPTTALDPTTATSILDLIRAVRDQTGAAVLYITHDIGVVAQLADEVAVIRAGRLMEQGSTHALLEHPRDPYTRDLMAAVPNPFAPRPARRAATDTEIVLAADDLHVDYSRPDLWRSITRTPVPPVSALNGVSLRLRAGETLALVGESGCGKSTLAKSLVGLTPFTGTIRFGTATFASPTGMTRAYRQSVQLVFQNPDLSLNPRMSVGTILDRPLGLAGRRDNPEASVADLLAQVRLPASYAGRYPHQLSGGERQRVAIARALATRPRLLICDEIASALDVTTQAAIVALLRELQAEFGLTLLFISHDINLVRGFADRVTVMYLGEVMEELTLDGSVPGPPLHPYTEALFAATPVPDPAWASRNVRLDGPLPSPSNRPPGCPLQTRCPYKLGRVCETDDPPLRDIGTGHRVACHIPTGDLAGHEPIWSRKGR